MDRTFSISWIIGLMALAAIAGCSKLNINEQPCPCATGWTCCKDMNVCVENGATCPGGVVDAEPSFQQCSNVSGTSCTWAGIPGQGGFNGDGHDRRATQLYYPVDLTFAPDGRAWIVDYDNYRVRRVERDNTVETMVGNGIAGDGPPDRSDTLPYGYPQGAPGTQVALSLPNDLAFLPDGTAILAAWKDNKVREIYPDDTVKTLAGSTYGFAGDGGPAADAKFYYLSSVAVDSQGRVYVIDQANERIRVISSADIATTADAAEPTITTLAGDGDGEVGTGAGYAGDGATVATAEFDWDQDPSAPPNGALAIHGRYLYVADTLNSRIRRIDLVSGKMACIAGDGNSGYTGDGGPAIDAELNDPNDVELGPDGRLYVADTGNNVIRAIDLQSGDIDTVAGTGEACPGGPHALCIEDHEGVPADQVRFHHPSGIAFDQHGNLYVADEYNQRIVRIAR